MRILDVFSRSGAVFLATLACTTTTTTTSGHGVGTPDAPSSATGLAGIPTHSDLVSVLPFFRPDLFPTMALIPVTIDSVHGHVLIDTGDYWTQLLAEALQRSPTGGVEPAPLANVQAGKVPDTQLVSVTFRLGTLVDSFAPPAVGSTNAIIRNVQGGEGLGNIGLPALEPLETIIDYAHRRVIFIRLDSLGRRRVDVPAYPYDQCLPLVSIIKSGGHWGMIVHRDARADTLLIDTGKDGNAAGELRLADTVRQALALRRPFVEVGAIPIDTIPLAQGDKINIIGYEFLHAFGAVGFNFRTRCLLLYRYTEPG